jgi:hypothetical protein
MNIIQCDGCAANESITGGEYQGKKIKRVAVSVIWPGVTDTTTNSYDLCENCRTQLRAMADPRTWSRQKAAAAEPEAARAAA